MSTRDNQKVWWIKREKNYFDKHNIKVLLKEKNGPIFFILYEKMCCESIPWKGELKYSSDQVYDEKKLSAITEIPLKLVTSGLAKLQELEFIEIKDDGVIYIPEVACNLDYESYQTKRKRSAKGGKNYQENTTDLPNNEVNSTLDYRLKTKDLRLKTKEDIFNYCLNLKEEYERVVAAYRSSDLADQAMSLVIEAVNQIKIDKDYFLKLFNLSINVIEDESIINKQAYLITSVKKGALNREQSIT